MPQRFSYGGHAEQFGELTLPHSQQPERGTVVIIHGGYWRSKYSLELGRPLAADLAARGWAAVNLEYRRAGNGGGWPETFEDISAGIDALAGLPEIAGVPGPVIALGHSAGGHLAVWAAGRSAPRVPLNAVVSQSGVLDLRRAHELGLSDGAAENFLGAGPDQEPERWRLADPVRAVPAPVPVFVLHGATDTTVPLELAENYVKAADAAGGTAELRLIPGDHFDMITPGTPAWAEVLRSLDDAAAKTSG
ncbi:alpha/beta hydrolase family protein [Arthrobacter koreensis]|uniref:alpha/beta hydrolase family protein n=1 Tax=Arthrobacter koreensis TaxID=199136 RepID=UPI002DB7B6B3|nr:alpha/beta hydrolase [Arthrobacter koreensis]MEB7447032.1 alpha/beta hydrolase [Arthrobacter koreensis]